MKKLKRNIHNLVYKIKILLGLRQKPTPIFANKSSSATIDGGYNF